MTHLIKTLATAAVATGLIAAAALPGTASAYNHYVCKYEQKHDERTGTVVGAVAGGAIGGSLANTHNKGLGTVIGALAGGAIGSKMGHDHGKTACGGRALVREEVHYQTVHGHREKVVYRYVR